MCLALPISQFRFAVSVLCLAALALLPGCDRATELKEKAAALASAMTGKGGSGPNGNPKYPVNADTARILALALELADDDTRRQAIKNSHADWLKLRESHCGAMEKLEKEGATSTAGSCYASLDKQRLDSLNQIRLALLLGKSAPTSASAIDVNVSIAFETGRYHNRVVVAPGGALAAVSSPTGEIDIYDLVNGQRVRSFNGERQAVRVAFSQNGRLLLVGKQQSRGVKVFDLYGGDELKEISEIMGPYVSLDGGRLLVYADGAALGIYDVANGKPLATGLFAKSTINALAVDPETNNVSAATREGWISLWQIVRIGEGGGMTARPLSESRLYGNNQYVQEMEFLERGHKLFVVVAGVVSGGDLELLSVPEMQRTRTTGIPGLNLRGLSRIASTDKVALLANKASGQGTVLAVLDLAAGTGVVMDESRQFLAVASVGDLKGKLLFVNSQGMWTKDLPSIAAESLADVMARVATLAAPPASVTTAVPSIPMAPKILPNTRVEAIGVYEGVLPGGRQRAFQEKVSGTVTVTVGSQQAPLALVLSSYEPVNWVVQSGGARITHILISGSAESKVNGVTGADVMRIGSAYAYAEGDAAGRSGRNHGGTGALNASVMRYLGRGIDRFQGAYKGSSFSVGTQAGGGVIGIQRSTDSKGQAYYGDRPPQ